MALNHPWFRAQDGNSLAMRILWLLWGFKSYQELVGSGLMLGPGESGSWDSGSQL